jgi:hypothetical protein
MKITTCPWGTGDLGDDVHVYLAMEQVPHHHPRMGVLPSPMALHRQDRDYHPIFLEFEEDLWSPRCMKIKV